jgi:signal transduction histidine kinase
MQTAFNEQNALGLPNDDMHSTSDATNKITSKHQFDKTVVPLQKDFLLFTIGLAVILSALVFGLWLIDVFTPLQTALYATRWTMKEELIAPPILIVPIVLILVSLSASFSLDQKNIRKTLILAGGFFALWYLIGITTAYVWQIDLLFFPAVLTAALTLFLMQLKTLRQATEQLSEKLEQLTVSTHVFEGQNPNSRTISGLALLQTILPVEEIVVFQLDEKGVLVTAGRAEQVAEKTHNKPKHAEWREGIELCDEALEMGVPVIRKISGTPGAARVAVPLVHDDCLLGAMLVRFRDNFEEDDTNLLIAFAAQLARNFQRQEIRQIPKSDSFFDVLSPRITEHHLESLRVIKGLLTEHRFGSMAFAEMIDGYAIAYLDGTLAYMNRPMIKAAQITPDRAQQIDLFGLLDRFKDGVFDDPRVAIRRVMQTGNQYQHEIAYPSQNQTLDLRIALVRESLEGKAVYENNATDGKPLCFIISIRDVSVQKENEKLRSDVVSLMSHEMRTPITSINGFAELLRNDESISEDSREFLEIISNESQRLSRILNTFLSVSHLEKHDKREVIKVPIRLDSVVHEVLQEFQTRARKKRIRLVGEAKAQLSSVSGDKGLITKAVTHLVDNALRYSPDRTTVTVSTFLEDDSVRVVVEDRGYGIPADSLDKVWEKFYRVPREGQDKDENSTGLGLSFVKEVVEQHGGAVFVQSEVNHGSKFGFTLPRL